MAAVVDGDRRLLVHGFLAQGHSLAVPSISTPHRQAAGEPDSASLDELSS